MGLLQDNSRIHGTNRPETPHGERTIRLLAMLNGTPTNPAEGAGFEPAVPYSGTPLFESGTINHSDTLPPRSISCLSARCKIRRYLPESSACSHRLRVLGSTR